MKMIIVQHFLHDDTFESFFSKDYSNRILILIVYAIILTIRHFLA